MGYSRGLGCNSNFAPDVNPMTAGKKFSSEPLLRIGKVEPMHRILVSACLAGEPLRYDGSDALIADSRFLQWQSEGRLIAVCPEVSGGLSVPRIPAEIVSGDGDAVLAADCRVVNVMGTDVTAAFLAGAERALSLCQQYGITIALLTEFSPSCGISQINDGSFSRTRVAGTGVTAALLRQNGIAVFNQFQLDEIEALLKR